MKIKNKQGYTVMEFVELFPMSDKTVYKKIRNGDIPVYPFGKPYVIPNAYVDELILKYNTINIEETPTDHLLNKKLEDMSLAKNEVQIQETDNDYFVFAKDMSEMLFQVEKC